MYSKLFLMMKKLNKIRKIKIYTLGNYAGVS